MLAMRGGVLLCTADIAGYMLNQPYGHKASPALCSLVNFSERFGIPISANPVNYVSN